eukprot:17127-Heterococcus_DN1.PRE.2
MLVRSLQHSAGVFAQAAYSHVLFDSGGACVHLACKAEFTHHMREIIATARVHIASLLMQCVLPLQWPDTSVLCNCVTANVKALVSAEH